VGRGARLIQPAFVALIATVWVRGSEVADDRFRLPIRPGAAAIDTGSIKINAPSTGVDFNAPSGGENESSYGPREQGFGALAFYSSTRTVTISPHAG
jgi:acyl-CoA reductase-like NAD-dependent aldehyde dehydrogenase